MVRSNTMVDHSVSDRGLSFDLSDKAWEAMILKPGTYDAVVTDARVSRKNETTYLRTVFEIADALGEVRKIENFSSLDAPPSSPRHGDTARGRSWVKAILAAHDKPLAYGSVDEVPAALLGCRVTVGIEWRTRDGLQVPIVSSIQGPASEPERAANLRVA